MGRETKLLLALLATLAGVFVGVLSMKLLVPRPPAGAGPDVHVESAAVEPHLLVAPPALSPPMAEPAAADPVPLDGGGFAGSGAGRNAAVTVETGPERTPPRRDPFVTAAALEQPRGQPADVAVPADVVQPAAPTAAAFTHVVTAGDSWWDLAERAYGDGRLYRALFAWNRVVDPRVSLTPGTRLEMPPRERLEAAWPKLLPPR
jgi:5'-nucleotidase